VDLHGGSAWRVCSRTSATQAACDPIAASLAPALAQIDDCLPARKLACFVGYRTEPRACESYAEWNAESAAALNAEFTSTGIAMTNSSFLGGERAARYATGRDIDALGPSDSSDSGSDVQGERSLRGEGEHADELGSLVVGTDNDSDSSGTGERASATGRDVPDGADIMPDHVIGPAGELENGRGGSSIDASLRELAAEQTDPEDEARDDG